MTIVCHGHKETTKRIDYIGKWGSQLDPIIPNFYYTQNGSGVQAFVSRKQNKQAVKL